jgi:hypothetical protein
VAAAPAPPARRVDANPARPDGPTYARERWLCRLIGSRDRNAGTGTVHILAMLRWLVRHHYESAGTRVGQIDFGWEICSTGGVAETFKVTDYTLRTRRA